MKLLLILLLFNVMHEPRNIQSGYTASDFWQNWDSVNPRVSLFILVTPQIFWSNVSPAGFTSNTRDMILPGHSGITFKSSPGITPTQVEQSLGEAGNLELTGIYQSNVFEREDVLAGKWNFAKIEVFSACWDNVNLGEFVHFSGNLGEFKDREIYFEAEGRGLIDRLANDVNVVTQRTCRVKEFGDEFCKKDLSGTVELGGHNYKLRQVNKVGAPGLGIDNVVFDLTTFTGDIPGDLDELEAYAILFRNGKITALTGRNAGVSREIAEGTAGGIFPGLVVYVKRSFPFEPEIGDTYTITMGCIRTVEDCRKYDNIINFRGEPFVPGIESANRIGSGN